MSAFLVVIADRAAVGWILSESRTAFPSADKPEVWSLRPGDDLLLYTTRRAFGSPTRDRGRVIGTAQVASHVDVLENPVCFGGRQFPIGCDLELKLLVPYGSGVILADHVSDLDTFKDAGANWSLRLRRALLQLSEHDARFLSDELLSVGARKIANNVIAQYARWFRELDADNRAQ